MKQKRITRTEEEWERLILQCQNSGQTTKAWCEEHGISVATFYNRMNRTKNKSCIHPQPVLEDETLEEQNVVSLSIIDNDSCIEDPVPSSGYDPAVTLTIGRCHVVIQCHLVKEATTEIIPKLLRLHFTKQYTQAGQTIFLHGKQTDCKYA